MNTTEKKFVKYLAHKLKKYRQNLSDLRIWTEPINTKNTQPNNVSLHGITQFKNFNEFSRTLKEIDDVYNGMMEMINDVEDVVFFDKLDEKKNRYK